MGFFDKFRQKNKKQECGVVAVEEVKEIDPLEPLQRCNNIPKEGYRYLLAERVLDAVRALIYLFGFISVLVIMTEKVNIKDYLTTFLGIFTSITTILATVIGFYFGGKNKD